MAWNRYFFLMTFVAGTGLSFPAIAQDYLGVHLDTQREAHMRQHQQDMASGPSGNAARYDPPIEGKARHAAMRRHSRQYGEIMRKHGYRAADQWLAAQVAAGR